MDDIRTETPPASTSDDEQPPKATPSSKPLREVGPESEVRGGPEAADADDL